MNVNSKKTPPWIWLFAIFVAGWTFWCTRGTDGRPVATLAGFGAFAPVYWFVVYRGRIATLVVLFGHLAVLETAAAAALLFRPELVEIGTTLYYWIPSIVLLIVLGGAVASVIARRAARQLHSSTDN
jgi:hypothetical protein